MHWFIPLFLWVAYAYCSLKTSFTTGAVQEVMSDVESRRVEWRVVLSEDWDVLGPFPIQAREQHFLSPSYPVPASSILPVDRSATYPSAYSDGGFVSWSTAKAANGTLEVSFPNVRWAALRAFEGWAALQHHTLLHTRITVFPPSKSSTDVAGGHVPVRLLLDIEQGSFFTILPSQDGDSKESLPFASPTPKWWAGNIYAINASPPHAVPLPTAPSETSPTTYDLFVSGDYEIRLFGDPTFHGTSVPTLQVTIGVDVERIHAPLGFSPDHNVVPDFVDGWAFGGAIGIGMRSSNEWWTVRSITLADDSMYEGLDVSVKETVIAPTQTRVIPVVLTQSAPFHGTELKLNIVASDRNHWVTLPLTLHINQLPVWNSPDFSPIISTYFFGASIPTAFVAVPPKEPSSEPQIPLLFLHGAGVDVLALSFWECAPPRQESNWLILPSGRTSWGLDWHGPSTTDAWESVSALASTLQNNARWKRWQFPPDTKVLLLGHSNGGQGTWHVAARYPDRVIAAVPAAAYSKSQSYVPLIQSRSAHFVDPFVRTILETSLTPDDNDLFVTNLVDTPILAIHGGDDENVPVWHTRALVDALKTWRPDANVTFKEDPGQPHCYSAVFNNEPVQSFIDSSLASAAVVHQSKTFTLTVAIPSESGSLHGWRIISLETPGRLARLTVHEETKFIRVSAQNVRAFTVNMEERWLGKKLLQIEGTTIEVSSEFTGLRDGIVAFSNEHGDWMQVPQTPPIQPSGRMSAVLSTTGPLTLVVADNDEASLSAATRLAHDLDVYHKLDAAILRASEASGRLGDGNLVVIGGSDNAFLAALLREQRTPFRLTDGRLSVRGRTVKETSCAVFLHPHPTSTSRLTLVMFSESETGLERALRLFPLRTGLAVPDWIVLGEHADPMGMGGVEAAGVWGNEWSWNGGMSSF